MKQEMSLKIIRSPFAKMRMGLIISLTDFYFFSWWIANFGVEPLLLFAFFLFLPAFTFLRALLFFVTRVFETIVILLQRNQLCEHRRFKYLPTIQNYVKAFALTIFLSPTQGSTSLQAPMENQSLILSIGEIREISLPNLNRFTVGNNDSLTHKFLEGKKTLLIKAKKLGLSEIHIWKKNNKRLKIQVYVLSKSNQLKLLSIAESFKNLGLEIQTQGPWLKISGDLDQVSTYNQFLKLTKEHKDKIQVEVILSHYLKKKLLAMVIKALFDDHISGFKCEFQDIQLICHLNDSRLPSSEVENFLKKQFAVKFIRHNNHNQSKNYRIKMKIIQSVTKSSNSHSLGLYQLEGSIKSLFDDGFKSHFEKNLLHLKSLGIKTSLLAEPNILIRPNKMVRLQIGSDLPYQSTSKEGVQNTSFKFAGLKLKLKLEIQGDGYLLDYSAEVTKPGQRGAISGSKESASARISLFKPVQLFEISFQSDSLNDQGIKALSKTPFLGGLFKNKEKSKTYKKISGIIYLEEE
jgi:hypothetical protein